MKPSPSDPLLDRLALDFADETAPDEGDDALIERALRGALDAKPPARPRSRWPFLLAAAALLVGAGALARSWLGPRTAGSAPAPQAPVEAPVVVPAASETATPSPPPVESAAAVPASALPVSSAAPKAPSAAELFARANQARRDRHDDEAVRLYRELQRRYPESREAQASRVTLGQLLLDTKNDKQALGEFDGYLSGSKGSVSEEAQVGRARALGRLGRTAEERAAWQELLQRYPSSVHAPEARTRLKALAP